MRFYSSFVMAGLSSLASAATFVEVNLTAPLNWLAGDYLFPVEIIAGYNAPVDDYNISDWAPYILASCKSYTACTSAIAYQGK